MKRDMPAWHGRLTADKWEERRIWSAPKGRARYNNERNCNQSRLFG